jgi:putative transcriptional regulator
MVPSKTKKSIPKSQAARDLESWIADLRGGGERQVVELREHARLDVDARAIREAQGLTRQEFASRYGLSLRTVENWEDGRRKPEGPAKSLLIAIAFAPRAVAQAITKYRAGKLPGERSGNVGVGYAAFKPIPGQTVTLEWDEHGTPKVAAWDIKEYIRKAVKRAVGSALSMPSGRRPSRHVRSHRGG